MNKELTMSERQHFKIFAKILYEEFGGSGYMPAGELKNRLGLTIRYNGISTDVDGRVNRDRIYKFDSEKQLIWFQLKYL